MTCSGDSGTTNRSSLLLEPSRPCTEAGGPPSSSALADSCLSGCFHFVHAAADHSPLDMDFKGFPVEVARLEAHDFACCQAEVRRHDAHRSDGFLELVEQRPEFLDRQNPGLPETLRRTFHTDEAHGVHPVNIDVFPFHRPVEQNVHNAAYVSLTLWCKIEKVTPRV